MTPLEPLGDGPSPSEWDDAAPWEPEALETLFDEVDELVRRYVAFPSEHARHAVVLWAFHAHALDAFESTPRLALISPEKGSGKTRCLELLELLVPTAP